MQIPTFSAEKKLIAAGFDLIIGIDEAGRGPLAGPVIAAAVVAKESAVFSANPAEGVFSLIRDSKKLSAPQREKALLFIQENFYVGIGLCDHQTIDRMNILEATFLAMKKAVTDLIHKIDQETRNKEQVGERNELRCVVLVDGNKAIPNFSYEQKVIVGGDKTVKSISAASIVAKVTRDQLMMAWHEKYSEYGFDQHKGYGTKLHMDKLQQCGPSPIHRKSFEPVKGMLKNVV